jgi:N-methylhydantoinase A
MVEARYRAQIWELDVPIPSRLRSDEDVRAVEEAFHATHERVFAVREPGQYLECLLWKARVTAVLEKPQVRSRDVSGEGEAEPVGYAEAYFKETGLAPVPRYDGVSLPRGVQIEGPAIIREPTTTIVVYPGAVAATTPLGNYLLDVADVSEWAATAATEEAGAL